MTRVEKLRWGMAGLLLAVIVAGAMIIGYRANQVVYRTPLDDPLTRFLTDRLAARWPEQYVSAEFEVLTMADNRAKFVAKVTFQSDTYVSQQQADAIGWTVKAALETANIGPLVDGYVPSYPSKTDVHGIDSDDIKTVEIQLNSLRPQLSQTWVQSGDIAWRSE